jgi:PIN domain nuclease of toxin-antitoxin system
VIVLDTHAWIWWATEDRRLPAAARRRIDAAGQVGVCSISVWEVAMLTERGRLKLDREVLEWVLAALDHPKTELLDLTPAIAVRSARPGDGFHGDPADRIIVATAREHRAPLVTRDERIHRHGAIEAVW